MEALMAMDLQVATKAYIKVRDMKFIDLINRIKASRRLPGHNDQVCQAESDEEEVTCQSYEEEHVISYEEEGTCLDTMTRYSRLRLIKCTTKVHH